MPCCQLFAAGSDTYTSYGYCETITPDSGYQMVADSLTYTLAVAGGETVKITNNRFTMPEGNVSISCQWETAATTSTGITGFSINGVAGAVNNTTNTITITMPRGTDVTKLTPVIATKYPAVTKAFFNKKNMDVETIKIEGSVELAPLLELADAIVDIVETGTTLKENGLEVIEDVAPISARVIVNLASAKMKKTAIQKVIAELEKGLEK